MDNRYEIAEQNGMSREFADWFFDNKKAGCGNVWFMMMAAMWEGWQGRSAMLQGADGKPELTVWYGAMPETNGKTNWTAMLHRKGHHPWEGITIDRSEYPGRVRYEADRMRHLIGELADEPDILAYDAEAHSGYVYPGNSPVIPDGWVACSERMPKFGDYLVTDGKDFDVQMFNGEQFIPGFVWEDNITHWMPLPAAPKQGA